MSTLLQQNRSEVVRARTPASDLADIVHDFREQIPETEWLSRLRLLQPRENLHCLSASLRVRKRILDITSALGLILLTSPLILLTIVLVRCTSRGPIIYRQTRVGLNLRSKKSRDRRQADAELPENSADRRQPGRDRRAQESFGRMFTIYKFRTMRLDAEKHGAQFATQRDPRLTSIGWILRRTRIDELPQLWNVLRGDMSLVGPRPERPEFMRQLSAQIPGYLDRLGLKPGLTGIAQVVNGYDNELAGFRRKVAYDLLYLQNCCTINDLKIMSRTVWTVITGKGAL